MTNNIMATLKDEAEHLYKEYDMGEIVGGSATHVRPCSQEFLDALLADIVTIRRDYGLYDGDLERPVYCHIAQEIVKQCERLISTPALFPTNEAKRKFLKELKWSAIQIAKLIMSDFTGATEISERISREDFEDYYEMVNRPTYEEGLQPWSQFLDNHAPGSGTTWQMTAGLGTSQVVPPTLTRLLGHWLDRRTEVTDAIRKTSGSVSNAQTSNQEAGLEQPVKHIWDNIIARMPLRTRPTSSWGHPFSMVYVPEKGPTSSLERLSRRLEQVLADEATPSIQAPFEGQTLYRLWADLNKQPDEF